MINIEKQEETIKLMKDKILKLSLHLRKNKKDYSAKFSIPKMNKKVKKLIQYLNDIKSKR